MVRKLWCKDAGRLKKKIGGEVLSEEQIGLLTPKTIDKLMSLELRNLGYLAFRGLINNHQIEFDESAMLSAFEDIAEDDQDDDGPSAPQIMDNVKQTSFLHTADKNPDSKKGRSQAWYFLHLTFQEYFAATWIARHLQSKRHSLSAGTMEAVDTYNFMQDHKYNPQFEIVWWMVAGLLGRDSLPRFFKVLEEAPRDLIGGRHQQVLASCLNEARDRLDTKLTTQLEMELMKWVDIEIQIHPNYGRSRLATQTLFPETLLIQDMDTVTCWKLETLGNRSPLSEKAIQYMITALQGKDRINKKSAATAFCNQSTLSEPAIQALNSALQDEDENVRRLVAVALGKQSTLSESAIQSFIAALKDENQGVRISAASILRDQKTLPESAVT